MNMRYNNIKFTLYLETVKNYLFYNIEFLFQLKFLSAISQRISLNY